MSKHRCSVTADMEAVSAGKEEYMKLARFHYREPSPGPYAAIYSLRDNNAARKRLGGVAGVIVYSMPTAALELRNIATGGIFGGFGDRAMQLQMVNKNIRCISRVIIEPRYRGLGLAVRLVRETMPRMNVPIVEAMAVMGRVNPFFEKAGMKAYSAAVPVRCVKLAEALSMVGIEVSGGEIPDAEAVQAKLEGLAKEEAKFIEREIGRFTQSYGKRRYMPRGLGRTRYILSKLSDRPVYYIWFNPAIPLRLKEQKGG